MFKPVSAFRLAAPRRLLCASLVAATFFVPVHAATASPGGASLKLAPAVIDDSATVVQNSTPAMTWRSVSPKDRDNAIVGMTQVNVRLATAPWLGKSGKIYMVLPADSTGSVKIAWRTRGLLLDGHLAPGGRTLVYDGIIRDPRMEDVLDVQIEADGTRLSHTQQLRFHFEMDVE